MSIPADAVARVRPAVSRDPKAPAALRCILVEPAGEVIRLVATDRHRLVVAEGAGSAPERVLLDPDTLERADVDPGEFPDYERFLAGGDPAATTSATVDAVTLLADIEAAADDDAPLAVQLGDGDIRLGDAVDAPTLHVDAGYLHDALEAAGAGEVVIEASSPTAPVAVRSDTVVTILMPVRIAN